MNIAADAGYGLPFDLWWLIAAYLSNPVSAVDSLAPPPAVLTLEPSTAHPTVMRPFPRGIVHLPCGLLLVSSDRGRLHTIDPSITPQAEAARHSERKQQPASAW